MNKLRIIIRLYEDRTGLKPISAMSRTSRLTVKKYIKIWSSLGMSYEQFQKTSDSELNKIFCIPKERELSAKQKYLEDHLPEICKALSKKGMTTLKQWELYIKENPSGYGLTQFRLATQRYRMVNNPSMRMEHKAGDKLFLDYTGDKLLIYPIGEPPRQVEVFVAILGCSLLTYVEATLSQTKEDFITSCENAFHYYGGVPRVVVPDNLKSAVTKAGRYESVLNDEFGKFCEHYGVVAIPARVRKPKDKSHVENAVKLTYKDVFTKVDSLHCTDLISLNAAIRSAVEVHNNGMMSRRSYCRRSYYEDIERESMGSLNPIKYQIKNQLQATVDKYGYVRLKEDCHYYSVPHTYLGKRLLIAYTATEVEIYDGYDLVATHYRNRAQFAHTLDCGHLCPKHKAIAEFTPEAFLKQAREIGEDVEDYIINILETKPHIDQAIKLCTGVFNLARKVGNDRISAACRIAHSYGKYSFLELQEILNNKSDMMEIEEIIPDMPEHDNIRGNQYYQ